MQRINISLPDPLRQVVDGQRAEERLESKLLEGLKGAESELTPADWSAIRREALAEVEARKTWGLDW